MTELCIHGFRTEECSSCRTCPHGLNAARCGRCVAAVRAGKLVFSESVTEYRDQNGELVVTARGVGVRTERPAKTE